MRKKLCLGCWLWLIGHAAYAQLSDRGKEFKRVIGRARFNYRIDLAGTGVLCGFSWNDSLVGIAHLEAASPGSAFRFYDPDQNQSGVCSLTLVLPDSTAELAVLQATIRLAGDTLPHSLNPNEVLIAAWLPGNREPPPADSIVYQLSPVITVVTKPLGPARNSAIVAIYNGVVLVYKAILSQAVPYVEVSTAIVLGFMRIEPGMQLKLQIPSSIQLGGVQMQATFSSNNIPPTPFNAFIATWEQ